MYKSKTHLFFISIIWIVMIVVKSKFKSLILTKTMNQELVFHIDYYMLYRNH